VCPKWRANLAGPFGEYVQKEKASGKAKRKSKAIAKRGKRGFIIL
jgi:hypothetical protein